MKKFVFSLIFISGWAQGYTTIFNPFTGKPDFVGISTTSLAVNAILNQNTLQSGSTFYVSSGTVQNLNIQSQEILEPGVGIGYGVTAPNYNLDFECGSGDLAAYCTNISHTNAIALHVADTSNNPALSVANTFTGSPTSAGQWASAIYGTNSGQGSSGGVASYFQTAGSTATLVTATTGIGLLAKSTSGNAIQVDLGPIQGQNFNFIGATQSTVTYGLTVGSETVNGSGNGNIQLTISGSTYSVTSTSNTGSGNVTVGHLAVFSSTNATLTDGGAPGGGGTPANPANSVQYNNAGAFGGSNNFEWNATSVTIVGSSVSITGDGSQGNGSGFTGILDVYGNKNLYLGQPLFDVGSLNDGHQFYVEDQTPVFAHWGFKGGDITMGTNANAQSLCNIFTSVCGQKLDMGQTSGNMNLQSDTVGNGGGNIRISPNTVAEVIISSSPGVTISTTLVVNVGTVGTYEASFSTVSTLYTIDITTTGHLNSQQVFGSTVTSCGAGASLVGSDVAGTITTGSASPTACTLTFNRPFNNVPVCLCGANGATACDPTTISKSAVTFTLGVTETTIKYICIGSD